MTKYLKSKRLHNFLIVFSLMYLGTYLRLWNLDFESLRLDETQSIWQASHSYDFIISYMLQNVHLPMHNTLLHYWIKLYGPSVIAVRLMAAIPGVLGFTSFYFLAKEIFDDHKAKIALAIAAISPFWIWYSREIRMYSLLMFATVLSYLFFIRILKYDKTRSYVFYLLANLIGTFTHYFFSFALIAQVLYFFATRYTKLLEAKTRKMVLKLILVASINLLALSPWLAALIQIDRPADYSPNLEAPNAFSMVLSVYEFIVGFQPEIYTKLILGAWPLFFLLVFFFLTRRKNPFNEYFPLAVLGAFLPIVVLYAGSVLYKPTYLTRYLSSAAPMMYILLAWFVGELKGKRQKVVLVGVLFLMSWGTYNQFVHPKNPLREDYRSIVNYVESQVTEQDVVVVAPQYIIYPVRYYYDSTTRIATLPIDVWNARSTRQRPPLEEELKVDLRKLSPGQKKFYLIAAENLDDGLNVREYMDKKYKKLDSREFSKDLYLHVYLIEQ